MIAQRTIHAPASFGRIIPLHLPRRDAETTTEMQEARVPLPSNEQTLTWLMLTLLSAFATPAPASGVPTTRPATTSPHSPLTKRETEVLRLVAIGWTNARIAEHLFVSRRTVDQHLVSIYRRLGVSSRTAATRFALLNDLC